MAWHVRVNMSWKMQSCLRPIFLHFSTTYIFREGEIYSESPINLEEFGGSTKEVDQCVNIVSDLCIDRLY